MRAIQPKSAPALAHPAKKFKVVLLHEDLVSGLRGISVVERLTGQLEADAVQLCVDTWKFPVLRDSDLRARAIVRLWQANMIIVSADGGTDLPEYIRDIIEQALCLRSDSSAAIVALLASDPRSNREAPRVGVYLRKLAILTGFDFFCNQAEWNLEVKAAHDHLPRARRFQFGAGIA